MNPKKNIKIIGSVIHRFKKLKSTSDHALELTANSTPNEGTTIIADYQSAGKGQYGRTWQGKASENIYMSVILYPKFIDTSQIHWLHTFIAVSICQVLEHYCGLNPKIKWPNDILINDKKIAGILINNTLKKSQLDSSIIGLGLNANQTGFPNFERIATSLKNETGQNWDLDQLISQLLGILDNNYELLKTNPKQLVHWFNDRLYAKAIYTVKNMENLMIMSSLNPDGSIMMHNDEERIKIWPTDIL